MKMVEGSSHLDQRLQKRLFGLVGREPNQLPMLVRLEVSAGIEAAPPLVEFPLGPVEFHDAAGKQVAFGFGGIIA